MPAVAFRAARATRISRCPTSARCKTTNPATTAFMELRDARGARQGRGRRAASSAGSSYGRISPDLKRAVLVAEDDAFWQHEGVDFEQLQESIEADWARGTFVRGGSTITQQLAKNLYLSPSKNPLRKLRELHHRAAARGRAEEGAHPRAVSERDRVGRRHLRRGSGGARLLSRPGGRRSAPSRIGAARRRASSTRDCSILHTRPPRLLRRQQLILRRMGAVSPAGVAAQLER